MCAIFGKAILDGYVRAPVSLLLRSALNEARVVTDAAGNSKLAKSGEGGAAQSARATMRRRRRYSRLLRGNGGA